MTFTHHPQNWWLVGKTWFFCWDASLYGLVARHIYFKFTGSYVWDFPCSFGGVEVLMKPPPKAIGFLWWLLSIVEKLGLHGEYVCILETSVSSPACLYFFSFPVHWHHLLCYNPICAKLTWLSCDDDDDSHTFAVSTRETLVSEMAPILPWMSELHDIKRRKRVHVCWVNQYLTASLRWTSVFCSKN